MSEMFEVRATGLEEFRLHLGALAGRAKDLGALLRKAGEIMVGQEIPRIFESQGIPRWKPVTRDGGPGDPLQDRGTLRDSVFFRVEGDDLFVGTPVTTRYARLQQFGGVVQAKPGKFLAIPLAPPLTPSQRRKGDPRSYKDTFIAKGFIFRKLGRGKGARIEAIFKLVRQVRIPARPFLLWTESALQAIGRKWLKMLERGTA